MRVVRYSVRVKGEFAPFSWQVLKRVGDEDTVEQCSAVQCGAVRRGRLGR